MKRGLIGGVLLVGAGTLPFAFRSTLRRPPHAPLRLLTADEYAMFAAVAARIVPGDGAGPPGPPPRRSTARARSTRCSLAHPTRRRAPRLLRLFESGLSGLVLTRKPTPFTRLAPAEQDARLEAWRHSRLALLRSGYQALKRLAQATYYSSPEVYALVGYPGPPDVPQGPA